MACDRLARDSWYWTTLGMCSVLFMLMLIEMFIRESKERI
jgi:hypothetical protein